MGCVFFRARIFLLYDCFAFSILGSLCLAELCVLYVWFSLRFSVPFLFRLRVPPKRGAVRLRLPPRVSGRIRGTGYRRAVSGTIRRVAITGARVDPVLRTKGLPARSARGRYPNFRREIPRKKRDRFAVSLCYEFSARLFSSAVYCQCECHCRRRRRVGRGFGDSR